MVAGEDGEILDLLVARRARVGAGMAYEIPIAQQQEIGVGVEDIAAGGAAETGQMPSLPREFLLSCCQRRAQR